MIFVTVGSMFPFDRLIRVMDEWTAAQGRDDVFAQIGNGTYEPKYMKWTRKLDQLDFAKTVQDSELIVAHAGMGSVIMADQYAKPIVLLPRIKDQGEHTTDHQLATAAWLNELQSLLLVYAVHIRMLFRVQRSGTRVLCRHGGVARRRQLSNRRLR